MFLYSFWRSLPISTRILIADLLGIKKHGPTHVRDNQVESDGYLIKEVEDALHLDKLQALLQTDERDLATLFKMLVDKVEGSPVIVEVVSEIPHEVPVEVKKVRKPRVAKPKVKKNAKA